MNIARSSKLAILSSQLWPISAQAYDPSSLIVTMSYSQHHPMPPMLPWKLAALILCLTCPAHPDATSGSPRAREKFLQKLVAAAIERTHDRVRYDPAYVRIPYPNGDVSADTGVCTDEVIRSYWAVGVDLQKEVHEDMAANFSAYPHRWNWLLRRPDANIDHRRVPNLMVFFQRHGEVLPTTTNPADYHPGDLVSWDLGGNVPHIGILIDQKGSGGRYMIVHNIGQGPHMEGVLFRWKTTGHYRYYRPSH